MGTVPSIPGSQVIMVVLVGTLLAFAVAPVVMKWIPARAA